MTDGKLLEELRRIVREELARVGLAAPERVEVPNDLEPASSSGRRRRPPPTVDELMARLLAKPPRRKGAVLARKSGGR